NICMYAVAGMHCASCEVLLQQKIAQYKGVDEVTASLKDRTVQITYRKGHKPQLDDLNRSFADLGYTFSDKHTSAHGTHSASWLSLLAVVILFAVLYVIIQDTHLLARFTLDSSSSLLAFAGLGVVASLSSCAALVGGLLLALGKQWNAL